MGFLSSSRCSGYFCEGGCAVVREYYIYIYGNYGWSCISIGLDVGYNWYVLPRWALDVGRPDVAMRLALACSSQDGKLTKRQFEDGRAKCVRIQMGLG